MEGVETKAAAPPLEDFDEDFASVLASYFRNSSNDQHRQIRDAIGAMSEVLKDQSLPPTPVAYLGATCSSIDRLSSSSDLPSHLLDALFTILSITIGRLPSAVIETKYAYLSGLLIRILGGENIGIHGVVAGLKSASRLLIVRGKVGWADVEELYGLLISFMTDDRIEGVIYVLDALKFCLPCMPSKSSTSILMHFKSLLALRRPLVTRRITDGLNALCLHSSGGVSAEVLLDMLCSVATSASECQSSADGMEITAHILTSGHEEALTAAVATFRSLIHSCLDESLINLGVDQITVGADSATRKSVPTVIEKVCATIESLLDYHHEAVWDMSFQIISAMSDKLGKYSFYLMRGTLKSLADMQKLPDGVFALRKQLAQEGKVNLSRSIDEIVYSLWSLLPPFCNYPVDTAHSLKGLKRSLCTALEEEPDVRGIICSSLQRLIQQNKRILEAEGNSQNTEISVPEQKAIVLYSEHVAGYNLSSLRSLAILTTIYFRSSKDIAGILQDKEVVTQLFKRCRQRLVVIQGASKNSNLMQVDNLSNEGSLSSARAMFFDLAVSLLPGLDSKEIDSLLFLTIPGLKDEDEFIEKKAYKVLSVLVQYYDDFVSRKLEEVLTLMTELLPSCHSSARCHRLDCLYFLIVHVSKVNKKTRSRACDILIHIGHAFRDEKKDGNNEKLHQYFNMVAGGLTGETAHVISATITALARLAYNVIPSTFILLQRKNKEIIKVHPTSLKVPAFRGLLSVKLLLEMVVDKCGLNAVKEVMPEDHMKLLTNIRKLKVRNQRKQKKQELVSSDGWNEGGSLFSHKRRKMSEYASRKAGGGGGGGGLRRIDKLELYVYWSLDRRMTSRKPECRAAARKGMASVVKLGKKF
ncbi:hypothetical protein C2S52_015302 [Perilla frutescens var. hirtella]|nr:hypothetical protein C2S52_015302 [Perilla frutescens var. hirtella]